VPCIAAKRLQEMTDSGTLTAHREGVLKSVLGTMFAGEYDINRGLTLSDGHNHNI
jgi:hypothetical protein